MPIGSGNIADIPVDLAGLQEPLQLVGERCGFDQTTTMTGAKATLSRTGHRVYNRPTEIALVYSGADLSTGSTEKASTPTVYQAMGPFTIVSGGTGNAVGDILTGPATSAVVAWRVRVSAVNAGAVTALTLLDPGVYDAPLAAPMVPASTTGAGTGATFGSGWQEAPYLVHAAIEPDFTAGSTTSGANVPRGVTVGLKGDGSPNKDICPRTGDVLVTDSVKLNLVTSPQTIGIRQWQHGGLAGAVIGQQSIIGVPPASAGPEYVVTGTPGDVAASGSTLAGQIQAPFMAPVGIIGRPVKRVQSICVVGQSQTQGVYKSSDGTGDRGDTFGAIGWIRRAGSGLWPIATYAKAGTKIADLYAGVNQGDPVGRPALMKWLSVLRPTDVIVDRILNDIGSSASVATCLQLEQQTIREIRAACNPDRVWLVTTTPQTTSTDNWTTVSGQTILDPTRYATTQARNAQLRAGTWAAGHDAFLDWGTFVETTVGSGIWPANVTGDGTHLLETVHAAAGLLMRIQLQVKIPANQQV